MGSTPTAPPDPGRPTPPSSPAPAPAPPASIDPPAPPAPPATPPPPASEPPAGPARPGADTTVTPFAGTHVYFAGGMDNKRIQDVTATFPAMPQTFERIALKFALRCPPAGGCDHWDRRGSLGIVRKVDGVDAVTEVLRFMTPYRAPASWTVDVTALRPLLSGEVTVRVFIDTWVGPGHVQGAGWLVDAAFEMKGGTPARLPIAVIPLWDEMRFDYGDPAKPVAAAVPPRQPAIPADATRGRAARHHHRPRPGQPPELRRVLPAHPHLPLRGDERGAPAVAGRLCHHRRARPGWQHPLAPRRLVPGRRRVALGGRRQRRRQARRHRELRRRPLREHLPPRRPGLQLRQLPYNNNGHTAPYYWMSAALIVYR